MRGVQCHFVEAPPAPLPIETLTAKAVLLSISIFGFPSYL